MHSLPRGGRNSNGGFVLELLRGLPGAEATGLCHSDCCVRKESWHLSHSLDQARGLAPPPHTVRNT